MTTGYSDKVLDHGRNPRNNRELPDPDGYAKIKGPCGDTMEFFLRLRGDGTCALGFLTNGCITSHAAGSMATELGDGKELSEILAITPEKILEALDGLPKDSEHCALLATNTLRAAVQEHLSRRRQPWKQAFGRPGHR